MILALKLACVIVLGGSLGVLGLSSGAVEAGIIHPAVAFSPLPSAVTVVRCERSFSNLWSCNDPLPSSSRRGTESYHPCDHSYQTARDGSRCGNRAADKRRGGQ